MSHTPLRVVPVQVDVTKVDNEATTDPCDLTDTGGDSSLTTTTTDGTTTSAPYTTPSVEYP